MKMSVQFWNRAVSVKVLCCLCCGIVLLWWFSLNSGICARAMYIITGERTDKSMINVSSLTPSYKTSRLTSKKTETLNTKRFLSSVKRSSSTWNDLDILKLTNFVFEPSFKNPCWWTTKTPVLSCAWKMELTEEGITHTHRRHSKILRCLPYFFLVGQSKSDTTDLFAKLIQHPEIAPIAMKETQWVCRSRNARGCTSIENYLNMFQKGANFIQKNYKPGLQNSFVIGEGTPGYLSNNDFWDMLPGNEGCKEPCVTNADLVHHLNPGAKIIVILRNPVDRLLSLYLHKTKKPLLPVSAKHFHELVVSYIEKFRACLQFQSVRGCCYNYSLWDSRTEEIDLRRGIYYVFLSDWLKVYPRHQILILKFEHYVKDVALQLQKVYSFLNLTKRSEKAMEKLKKDRRRNGQDYSKRGITGMWNITRHLLESFYKPYNKLLKRLLQNDNFQW